MNNEANEPTWFDNNKVDRAADPAYVVGWWDEAMSASDWWNYADVTPVDAALVLCRVNRLSREYRSPEHAVEVAQRSFVNLPAHEPPSGTVKGDDRRLKAFDKMRTPFESVWRSDPASRTMAEWLRIARQQGLAYDRWVDEWLDARAMLGLPESQQQQQVSADVPPIVVATPSEPISLSKADRQAEPIGDELRAINALREVLIRSDRHGPSQAKIIEELMGYKSELPRGLLARNWDTIFAAAKRGDKQVAGVDPQTVRKAVRVLCEHLLRGGQASVPVEDVRKLFAEAGLSVPAPLESLLAAEPQSR